MAARRGATLRDHTILALDIGTRFIKVAELKLAKGQISLLNIAVGPTPPGVMDASQILDPVGLGKAIRELLALNKVRTRRVVVGVSGQNSVVVRPIELPKMTRKELVDTMKFEVERHIPFAVDEVIMDYAPFVPAEELPDEEPNMKVLLAVAQEELVLAYIKTLAVAGLTPAAIDVQVLAGMRALVDAQQAMGAYDQTMGLVNLGASTTDIAIVDRGILSFCRSVPLGGDALSSAIADQLGRTLEEAEELKIEQGRIFLDSVMGELPSPGMHAAPTSDASGFGAPAAAAPVVPPPRAVFSLDDAFGVPGPLSMGGEAGPETTDLSTAFSLDGPAPVIPAPPVFSFDDATPPASAAPAFTLGEPEAPATPVFSLGDEPEASAARVFSLGDEPEAPAVPVFSLDEPQAEAPEIVAAPEPAPQGLGGGAVFDLSSELMGQMPSPLSRPAPRADEPDDEPSPFTFGAPANGNGNGHANGNGNGNGHINGTVNGHLDAEMPLEAPAVFTFDDEPAPVSGLDETQVVPAATFDFGTPAFMPDDAMSELEATTAFARPDEKRDEMFQRRVFEAMLPTLGEIVTEIRRSLEYHGSREPDRPVERIMIFGGTSRMPGLAEFIQHEVGVTVEVADPLLPMDLSSFQQSQEYLQELSAALPVAVGLGMRDMIA